MSDPKNPLITEEEHSESLKSLLDRFDEADRKDFPCLSDHELKQLFGDEEEE